VLEMLMTLFVAGCALQASVVDSRPLTIWIIDVEDILPPAGRGLAHDEANRIWSRYGIELHWSSRRPPEGAGMSLVVLVNGTREDDAPLGRVTRVGDMFRRHIIVSDPAIIHLLTGSGVERSDPMWVTLYARMFARVVSHELGHLLLNSVAHSQTGLMRGRFVVEDVRRSAADAFCLTADELATIRATLAAPNALTMK
jgi:hypothetical protein